MSGWSLSVDFGTSNTSASIRRGADLAVPVQLSDAGHTMPSAVLLMEGRFRVGSEAVRAARLHPEGFEESPKTRLGEGTLLLDDQEVPDIDLVAAVLDHAARRAIRVAGGSAPDRVVLTHPFEWAAPRREVLRAAWERTGIAVPVVVLVSEPIAAATWYAQTSTPPVGSHVAVLDLGGGTCDIAVLRVDANPGQPWVVVGHGGAADLGGRVVDQILMAHVLTALRSMGRGDIVNALNDPFDSGASLRTLIDQVRQAKHALAEWPDATVPVAVGSLQATVRLTADELAALIAPVVSRVRALTERAFAEAGVTPASLHALYLTGGSSHLRPVADMVRDLLGGAPATMDDPKLVVCLGAHRAADLVPAADLAPVGLPHPSAQPDPVHTGAPTQSTPELEQPGASTKKRSPWRWLIPVGIAVVVAVGALASLPGGNADGGTDGQPPASTPVSTPDTSSPPSSDPMADLMSVVPAAFKDCSESDAAPSGLDGEVVPGSTAMVRCTTTYTDPAGTSQEMTGWFTLFDPTRGVNAYFDADVPSDIRATVAQCPATPGAGTYRIEDSTAGDYACFTAAYDTGEHPTITWTRDVSGVVGELIGPAEADIASIWDFWLNSAQIGEL